MKLCDCMSASHCCAAVLSVVQLTGFASLVVISHLAGVANVHCAEGLLLVLLSPQVKLVWGAAFGSSTTFGTQVMSCFAVLWL